MIYFDILFIIYFKLRTPNHTTYFSKGLKLSEMSQSCLHDELIIMSLQTLHAVSHLLAVQLVLSSQSVTPACQSVTLPPSAGVD